MACSCCACGNTADQHFSAEKVAKELRQEEAVRRGRSASTELVHGDRVAVASQLAPATAVTLDRVVCCHPFYERLLEQRCGSRNTVSRCRIPEIAGS